ncbi:class I SAM-dependent methyltransferase [Ornithinibacillus xuwenensis]|uniref:Class I SAM-dependent methyltransferase n=1 Tax=Ornithinibacillus xuwenensis TaxID=3144668 RepID=A0ABU9XFM9_9BACI
MTNPLNYIVGCMAASELNYETQKIQTEHRLKLARFWGIEDGNNILEIGCGQGDTTAVLAYLVGENGFVHGVDIASPDYGAPLTLGESIDYLKSSSLSSRIQVDFERDILSDDVAFNEHTFDAVILSHSSWYLNNAHELEKILQKLKKWGKKLCFAEWDTRVTTAEQLPHFLAVLIQAQYECFQSETSSNVRTLFTPMDLKEIATKAGWNITHEKSIYSPMLQDGEWEIHQTLSEYHDKLINSNEMPSRLSTLIQSQIKLLEDAINKNNVRPMAAYTFTAE